MRCIRVVFCKSFLSLFPRKLSQNLISLAHHTRARSSSHTQKKRERFEEMTKGTRAARRAVASWWSKMTTTTTTTTTASEGQRSRAASNAFASCSSGGSLLNASNNIARSMSKPFERLHEAQRAVGRCFSVEAFAQSANGAFAASASVAQRYGSRCGGGLAVVVGRSGSRGATVKRRSTIGRTMYFNQVRAYAKSLSQMKEAGLKAYKPTTPGFRGRVITDRSKLWKGRPLKALTKGLTKSGGRNNQGRITVWHKGGGHKRLYRIIDFKRDLYGVSGVIRRIEYDPNRTTRIALVDYPDGIKPRYILAPDGAKAGDVVSSKGGQPSDGAETSVAVDVRPGNAMPLSDMPIGTIVHNVELVPGRGGALARSAGASATLVKKGADGYSAIKLPSGELRLVLSKCVATVGVLSNREHQNTNMGKAGAKRWKGVRPTVRGTAMNPIDHPHGGGEGRSKGNNQSVSPWGVNTKGKRTRNNKRTDNMRLQRRPMNRKRYPLLAK